MNSQEQQKSVIAIAAGLMIASGMSMSDSVRAVRKEVITISLMREGGKQCAVARILGMHRNTLTRQMDDLGITHDRRYWKDLQELQQIRAQKFVVQSASGSAGTAASA